MNILQIISGRGVNGALVYCKTLAEQLSLKGHDVTVLCRPNSWMATHTGCGVKIIQSSMSRFPLDEFRRVGDLIQDHGIELLHSHMTRGQNFGIGLKWMTGLPLVATAHNRHFELHWNFNDYVIANSQATYDFHRRVNWIPACRMEKVYCCSDHQRLVQPSQVAIDSVRRKLSLKPNDFLIALVGEISIRKGQLDLVRALPQIIEKVPTAKVVFVGRFGRRQKYVRKIRQLIIDLNLVGRTKWVGRQANVADYLAASQLAVMPSHEEPLGLVAIESLMLGTPVVATRTGGLKEIIRHEENGILIGTANPDQLAQAVVQMARNPDWSRRLALQGQSEVIEKFAPKKLIDQVEEIYFRLVAQNTRVAA
ncbi:MAG: glycosyltransferase family 4 protein [Planctomycetota bacterium]